MEKRILQCEKGEAGNTMQCKQKRYHFIINPAASSGKAKNCNSKPRPCQIFLSKRRNHKTDCRNLCVHDKLGKLI